MVQSKTLLVRHLPPNLSDDEKHDLMAHFGAVHVKVISSKIKKSSLLFAKFLSEEEASAALKRLHQLDVLGYPLTVEYAKSDVHTHSLPEIKQAFQNRKQHKENCQKHYENFLHKLNTWHNAVDFTQPPPAHLSYQYPPPSYPVLTNIMRTLAAVPKFYTQVLHLMNKMNLPSPFHTAFPEPDVLKQQKPHHKPEEQQDQFEEQEMLTSTDESEIESEGDASHTPKNVLPMKRAMPQNKIKVKRPKFVKPPSFPTSVPTSKSLTKPEEVFDKVPLEPVQRKISLNLTPGESSISAAAIPPGTENEAEATSGFGLLFPSLKDTEDQNKPTPNKEDVSSDEKICITSAELAANRISPRDQKHLSVFKNYQPGIPSCRLYIKNLSKQVESKDLHFIYSKYKLQGYEEQGSMFDIRLMKEGRMKGQAFVTLQNVKQAQLALNESNGYILKDKPMVVQFARSAMSKT